MAKTRLRFPEWIGIVCADLDAQRRFYRDALQFRETDSGEGWVQFDGGPGLTLELIAQSKDPEYDAPRYQVGFAVDDIAGAQEVLRSRGVGQVTEIKTSSDGTAHWAYFRDPEGNLFEITQRPSAKGHQSRRSSDR